MKSADWRLDYTWTNMEKYWPCKRLY